MKLHKRTVGGLEALEATGDPNRGTIVLFHGYGADADDLAPLSQVYEGPTWIFPQAPHEILFPNGYTGRAWFPVDIKRLSEAIQEKRFDDVILAFPPQLDGIRATIEEFLGELKIPRSHIMLGGFSQGAILAVETALHSTIRCGGLIIFSGTLVHEPQWRRLAPLHAGTPFFQSHGSTDPLLPLQRAEALAHLLIDSGFKGALHPFQGGHDIPQTILRQLALFLKPVL